MAQTYTVSINALLNINAEDIEDIEDYITYLQRPEVTEYLVNCGIKRGDIVAVEELVGYRNDGYAIWDGVQVISLDYDHDDYGGIPDTFFIGDFKADHWNEALPRNNVRWINTNDPTIKQQLLDNLTESGTSFTTALGTFNLKFTNGEDRIVASDLQLPDITLPISNKIMFEELLSNTPLCIFNFEEYKEDDDATYTVIVLLNAFDYLAKKGYSSRVVDMNGVHLINRNTNTDYIFKSDDYGNYKLANILPGEQVNRKIPSPFLWVKYTS